MRSQEPNAPKTKVLPALLMTIYCALGALLLSASPQATKTPARSRQKTFASPAQAVQALVVAADSYDVATLITILGPGGEDLVASQDPVADKNNAASFVALAREKQSITVDSQNRHVATISVGNTDWPLPIPLVEVNGQWRFDSAEAHDEILYRRIGENELDAIQVCRGFVEAQQEYASERHDDSDLNEYAQRIISTPGKHDGLAWQNPDGTWGGPVGEAVAKALAEGYSANSPPYHGYYFKVLKGQGPAAPLGQMDFVVEGSMIGGFALAAAPAQYKVTGVKTFIIGYQGIVYEKDLGSDTLSVFRNMERYNPDSSWHRTDDSW
jgi:hypothetical protein